MTASPSQQDLKQILACLALEPSDTAAAARFGFLLVALLLRDPKHLDHPEPPDATHDDG